MYVWHNDGRRGGGAFAQFGEITPISPYDPLYAPSQDFPYGEHWIDTTKVNYAWALVGYDQYGSPPVDLNDPSRVIAIIDTGIDVDHFEFGGVPGTPESKIHPESMSFLQDGYSSGVLWWCDCDTSVFGEEYPEDSMSLLPGVAPHGTFVARIAAAYSNDQGMAGVCWDCGLLVLRVLAFSYEAPCDEGQPGTQWGTLCAQSAQSMAAAIKFAAGWDESTDEYLPDPRARIISISAESQGGYTGLGCQGHIIADAIDEAVLQGCIIIAIAGNQDVSCWTAGDDGHCGLGTGFGESQINGGIAINRNTIAVGGVCLDDVNGPWWHCRSNVNPLRSNFDDCCPAPDGTNYCQILYPVGV
ncbi:MAG: hypothetical protein DYG94_13105 [Leptolyngbya sp. PLA3]|nr:MAG: hypothetical protein EDM82_13610 [Cyanobacteria bacterium CYA]MCE7969664.1 hypothetical protein [Leptolyngbya sp. PL-A3]